MPYQSQLHPESFSGQTIIVTGGGSGIGRCIAHEVASLGGHPVLIGRTEEKLAAVTDEIQSDGGNCSHYSLDIRDEDAVVATVAQVVKARGPIRGLVNNAGGQFPGLLSQIKRKGFEAVVRSNLVGGFLMSREVFNQSMAEHGGSIVNITADNVGGMPMMGHSGAARAGMENLTQTAAVEWASSSVRVNAVAPGYILSSGFDTYDPEFLRQLLPGFRETIPLDRLGEEAEVSAAVCFLLSDAARYITGQTLHIDGGGSLKHHSPLWRPSSAKNRKAFNGFHRSNRPKVVEELEAEGKL
ncbi:3-oxoacyl-[acyl-carrier-protein] reductase FabG [Microbulbifer aggregans]|uniref:Peroxisomal trans-2-enoyl-CoA reductase n=1 Tax=Microbulbifer aggregans TaxID=1769779 RepID=A0A1C9WAE4_9GAMM|nr:SDR family oxidoreductase [Microbulbifer aggregans]AOS98116.1 3-oxoacyl-[acyl-carrier-protein] reductase FabG [Microbulbifer aggregans]